MWPSVCIHTSCNSLAITRLQTVPEALLALPAPASLMHAVIQNRKELLAHWLCHEYPRGERGSGEGKKR